MKQLIAIFLLFAHSLAFAQSAEITVLNGVTREKKTYEVGAAKFDIPVDFVKGWKKCTALPIKDFLFNGIPTIRSEIFCMASNGAVQSISCVASGKNALEVTVSDIYGSDFQHVSSVVVAASTHASISLSCKN